MTQDIQSEAFGRAALQSDRYRIIGVLCLCATFGLLDLVGAIALPAHAGSYLMFVSWWMTVALYEFVLLRLTTRAAQQGWTVRNSVWVVNTIVECALPSLALLGLTADKEFLGPYRAMFSPPVLIYCILIILSTLRLSPALCVVAGMTSAVGYAGVYLFTLHIAPHNPHRNVLPIQAFALFPVLLLAAGVLAALVARQIRGHVIAALTEAETRRKLDRIEFDLNVARSIQLGLLPKQSPTIAGYEIAGWSRPADQTGGDFYDWIELPGGKTMIVIADAAGHGIGPALMVAACRAYFRAMASHADPLEQIIAQIDTLISADTIEGRFITAAVALLDVEAHNIALYSAGHGPNYRFTAADRGIVLFNADRPPLGTDFGRSDAQARRIDLAPGDALVLVTDGFFEYRNADDEMLGTTALGEAIRQHSSEPADRLIRSLYETVLSFANGAPQGDDLTAVVIKRCGNVP